MFLKTYAPIWPNKSSLTRTTYHSCDYADAVHIELKIGYSQFSLSPFATSSRTD